LGRRIYCYLQPSRYGRLTCFLNRKYHSPLITPVPINDDLSKKGLPMNFELSPFLRQDAGRLMGRTEPVELDANCLGGIKGVQVAWGIPLCPCRRLGVPDEPSNCPPPAVHIRDAEGRVIGYATGCPRPDIKQSLGRKAEFSGFKGYLLAEKVKGPITLRGTIRFLIP
jgi:hypothetical protein